MTNKKSKVLKINELREMDLVVIEDKPHEFGICLRHFSLIDKKMIFFSQNGNILTGAFFISLNDFFRRKKNENV